MRTLIKISAGILCSAGLIHPALADYGYGSTAAASAPPPSTTSGYSSTDTPPSSTGGYASSGSVATPPPPPPVQEHRHKKHNGISIALNIPGTNTVVSYGSRHGDKHNNHQQPFWIAMQVGEAIPANAVIGGGQNHPDATLYVCRANYHGGVHPGKYLSGNCNISWGGREVSMQHYEMLVSQTPLSWVRSSNGAIPHHAVPGGQEHHRTLYICQADYQNGVHIGKVVGNTCNFGWGGREEASPYYNVLVS